ncbi:MAG: hypothetical protein ABUT20_54180 [Bacteroidota bacterium]
MAKFYGWQYLHLQQSSKYLLQKLIIRQLIAGVLLLVFTFSITPKKFLHDAIANHKDKAGIALKGDTTQLSNSGFICKCDNLVAESPFTDAAVHFDFAAPQVFSVHKEALHYRFYSSTFFFFELRGPPACNHQIA